MDRQQFLPSSRNKVDNAFPGRGVSIFRPRVLVVDDHDDTRKMLRMILEMEDLQVIEAEDGEAALTLALQQNPHLILTDSNLPIVDGLGLTRSVRKNKRISGVPVIFISGQSDPGPRHAAMEAGCNDYLVKPIDVDKMLAVVNRWLSRVADMR